MKIYETHHGIEQKFLVYSNRRERCAHTHATRLTLTVNVDIQTAATIKLVEDRIFKSHGRFLILVLLNRFKSHVFIVNIKIEAGGNSLSTDLNSI